LAGFLLGYSGSRQAQRLRCQTSYHKGNRAGDVTGAPGRSAITFDRDVVTRARHRRQAVAATI
jgi:hypothetical protein